MSQSLCLRAALVAKFPDHAPVAQGQLYEFVDTHKPIGPPGVAKTAIPAKEARVNEMPSRPQGAFEDSLGFEQTEDQMSDWNPARRCMTNTVDHARPFVWCNMLPQGVEFDRRKLGLFKDDAVAAELRNGPDDWHVPDYECPEMPAGVNAAVHTVPATPGYVVLSRGQ